MQKIQELIQADPERMPLLKTVAALALPDCYIAAGFVRNMVWDYLHDYDATPLNDVDVVFFDRVNTSSEYIKDIEDKLFSQAPGVHWEVKNQAIMHLRNKDSPYSDSTNAMSYWPEKETAVGVRLSSAGRIEIAAPFGLDSLFLGYLSHNPRRSKSLFLERIAEKRWLERWPRLKVVL